MPPMFKAPPLAEQSAAKMIRAAFAQGKTEETAAIDYAASMLGESNRATVQRVFARDFRIMEP